MATSYHPSDIQYVSDSNIQLQSLSYTNNNGHGQPSYQDSTHSHDNPHQNGHYGNGGSSSSPAVYSPGHASADYEVVEAAEEQEAAGETPRLRTGPPKDFFGFALFVMVVFCSPIGLTAFQSARECRRAIYMRNMDIADAKSEEAKGRACLGLVTGLATWLVVAAFIVLGVLS